MLDITFFLHTRYQPTRPPPTPLCLLLPLPATVCAKSARIECTWNWGQLSVSVAYMGFFPGYSRHGCFVICTRAWRVYVCVCASKRAIACVCVCVDLVCCITILLSVVFFISKDVRPHGQLDNPRTVVCLPLPAPLSTFPSLPVPLSLPLQLLLCLVLCSLGRVQRGRKTLKVEVTTLSY